MSKKAETDAQNMTIDQAIQEFAGYARGENGFDELDLKEVIANRVAERIDETVDKLAGDIKLTELDHIMGQCHCESFMSCWFWDTKQDLSEDGCHATEFHKRQYEAVKNLLKLRLMVGTKR